MSHAQLLFVAITISMLHMPASANAQLGPNSGAAPAPLPGSMPASAPAAEGPGWYYMMGTDAVGPVSRAAIQGLYKARKLSADSLIWSKGMSRYTYLAGVDEFTLLVTYSWISVAGKGGPLSYGKIREALRADAIPGDAKFWRHGLSTWYPLAAVPELSDLASRSPSARPLPVPSGEEAPGGREKVRFFFDPSFFSVAISVDEDDDVEQYVGIGRAPLAYLGAQYLSAGGFMAGGAFGVAHETNESGSKLRKNTLIFLMGKAGWQIPLSESRRHRLSIGLEAGLVARLYGTEEIDNSVATFGWGIEALYHLFPVKHVSLDLGFRLNHLIDNENTTTSTSSSQYSWSRTTSTISIEHSVIFSVITGVSFWI